ncbi:probable NOT transcription complex subunit VIP2 [Henckelia pumila]|uniref:probable NOT transcription complex subunit VIP2 n=1 Tax=Henckelia pumila TaxID=405737 RepID=UPI003C6DBCBC
MWTPKSSNTEDISGRTYMTDPYSTPFVPSSAASNEFGGNDKGLHNNNIHGSLITPYFPASFESRSSTNIVDPPSSNGLTNLSSPASSLNFSDPCMVSIPENSHIGAPIQLSQNQYQDETGHFSYMRLLNNPNSDDHDVNVGVNDLCNLYGFYSSVGDPQGLPGLKQINNFSLFQHNQYFGIQNYEGFSVWSPYEGGLNFRGVVNYSATQHQEEHVLQPTQYPMGRSPGLMFGAINASNYPLQQDHYFHGSREYKHFQQPQPCFYNLSLRGKEVAQGSVLGPDDYGLLGFLKIIKCANPAKTALSIGVDPHSLGLDLNSLEPLHPKFESPWSDEPAKEGLKYDIPDCYNSQQPPPLKQRHFKKFDLPMLFYIFYSMPQDQAQLFAANELHDRGWYFHRELHMWFTRDKNFVPDVRNATFEVGSYVFFDPSIWQTIRQEKVVLYYEMIEQRPEVPQ